MSYSPNNFNNRIRISDSFAALQSAQILVLKETVTLSDIRNALRFAEEAVVKLRAIEQNMTQQSEPKIGG